MAIEFIKQEEYFGDWVAVVIGDDSYPSILIPADGHDDQEALDLAQRIASVLNE